MAEANMALDAAIFMACSVEIEPELLPPRELPPPRNESSDDSSDADDRTSSPSAADATVTLNSTSTPPTVTVTDVMDTASAATCSFDAMSACRAASSFDSWLGSLHSAAKARPASASHARGRYARKPSAAARW